MNFAPKIRVNGIAPGPTIKNKRQSDKHFKKQYLATPLKKQVDVNEICNAVDFFRMKKNNLKIVKIDKNKSLFNYEKKILIKELTLDLKLGYYEFEKEKPQKVKFSLEIDYEDKKPTSDKDIKSIVNYGQVVKLIKKLTKNKHYNFLETLAEDVFDILFKDKRIGKIMLQIEKLEILKECTSVGIQITKKRSHEKL
jgi:dihydroneopterin aldolase